MNSVLKFLVKLNADADTMMSATRRVTSQLDAIQGKARAVGESLKKAFSLSGFKDALMSVPGMEFLTNPYTMIGAGLGAITKIGVEAKMTANTFTTLVGNTERAEKALKDLKDFANATPFSALDVTKASQIMMGFNVTAEKSIDYVKRLGDVSMGDSEKLQSLSRALGQISGNGRLMGEELNQLIEQGFNPLVELSKLTGLSIGELRAEMEKGNIGFKDVEKALEMATNAGGRFYNVMNNLQKEVGTRFASLIGDVEKVAEELFAQIEPVVSGIIDAMASALPYLSSALKGLLSGVMVLINTIKAWWMELALVGTIIGIVAVALSAKTIALWAYATGMMVVSTATKVWTGIQWLLNAALTANPIGLVIVAVSALAAGVVYCWNKFAGFRAFIITMWDTIKQFGTIIKDYLLDRITGLIKGVGQVGQALAKLFSGDFSGAWDSAKEAYGNITGTTALAKAVSKGKEVVGGVSGQWQANLTREQAKDKKEKPAGIATPGLKGSATSEELKYQLQGSGSGKGTKGGKGGKSTSDAIATGGSRPTTINVSIGKFFDNMQVSMMDKADTHEIERVVLQALNRSLSIATSTE
ncbi:MAG: tape measure protein [Porphyromonas sp.]|nr:tape measure protein [Porphyromonas sp.]